MLLKCFEILLQLRKVNPWRLVYELLPFCRISEIEFCSYREILKTRKNCVKLASQQDDEGCDECRVHARVYRSGKLWRKTHGNAVQDGCIGHSTETTNDLRG